MKTFLPLFLVLTFPSWAIAQTVYPAGVSGCVARWTFSNVTNTTAQIVDSSNNGNAASAYLLGPSANFRNVGGSAASFAGDSTSYALVPHSSSLDLTQLTMIAVVRPQAFYAGLCQNSQILSKGFPHNIAGNYGFGFTDNIHDNGNCNSFDSTKQQLASQLGNNGGVSNPLLPGNYVTSNQWYFVATTFGGGQVRYYQVVMTPTQQFTNIQPIYSATSSSTVGTNTQPISLGRHLNPTYPYSFNGAMDEVILFNRALTTAEIQSVYNFIWAPPAPSTVNESVVRSTNVQVFHNAGLLTFGNLDPTVRSLRIFNRSGQTVYQAQGAPARNGIDVSVHRGGILFVQIQYADRVETVKFFND